MQLKEIVVTIKKDGTTSIEPTKGFKGTECLKETADLEAALGKLERRDPKPEMGQKSEVGEKISQG
jgi:Protein of unknown function (DUF2997)